MWVYGYKRFLANIEEMGIRIPTLLKYYWVSMWLVVTPLILFIVFIMTFVQYSPASSTSWAEKYVFPANIQAVRSFPSNSYLRAQAAVCCCLTSHTLMSLNLNQFIAFHKSLSSCGMRRSHR